MGHRLNIDWDMAEIVLKKAERQMKSNDAPATQKQLNYIKDLEKKHNTKFRGKTKLQASSFISKLTGKGK